MSDVCARPRDSRNPNLSLTHGLAAPSSATMLHGALMDTIIPTVKDFILRNFLQGENPDNLTPSTELIRSGVLDSLATLDLVAFLEKTYGIELAAHDVDPGNLGTLNDIERLVRSKRGAAA